MKKLLLLIPILFALTSCNNDDRLVTDEITSGPKVVGFVEKTFNYAYFEDEGPVEAVIPVNLIGLGNGLLPTSPISVTYQVVSEETTAVEGEEYTLGGTQGTIEIGAGQDFATIPMTVNTGSLNPSAPTQVKLQLTASSDGTSIALGKESATVQFVGCSTELEGVYGSAFDGQALSNNATITKVAPNKYRTDYLPAFSSYYWVEFTDVCGTLQVTGWQFQGGNPISDPTVGGLPAGYVADNGDLVFPNVAVEGVSWFSNAEVRYVKQ